MRSGRCFRVENSELNEFVNPPIRLIFYLRGEDDNILPTGEKAIEGFSITLDKVDRHQAGVYQCTASNGVGEPVTVDMQLDVLLTWWAKGFNEEHENVAGVSRSGRPSVSEEEAFAVLLDTDRRHSIRELGQETGLVHTTVLNILKERQAMSKITSRWAPDDLTEIQK
ncbi:hypothetical protein C0J52_25006 [Blattella germanica]|nr:hypothetical protein C0J52_25006 [Blattella germanica]